MYVKSCDGQETLILDSSVIFVYVSGSDPRMRMVRSRYARLFRRAGGQHSERSVHSLLISYYRVYSIHLHELRSHGKIES